MRLTGWFLLLITAAYSSAATVCEVIDHRLARNGKDIEVVGRLAGGAYTGPFICGKSHCDPCANRWIFSWPSPLGLYFEGPAGATLKANLETFFGKPVDIVVKGRLFTRSDYYVINLPWRQNRPLGKYSNGGVAGAILISDFKVKDTGSTPRR